MGNELPRVTQKVTPIDLLPQSLKKVREQTRAHFSGTLAKFFDSTDDALFELADKSANNADQSMYFDSMREVRLNRVALEQQFLKSMHDGFRHLYLPDDKLPDDLLQQPSEPASLSLVQDDELEESVAIRGMITKVSGRHEEAIVLLVQRMDHLVKAKPINDFNNPIGPIQICQAFKIACGNLEIDIRAKLVLYKLFDRHVLADLGKLYDGANRSLKDMGVLPSLKASDHRKVSAQNEKQDQHANLGAEQPASSQNSAVPGNQAGEQREEIFSFLRDLLADSREGIQVDSAISMPVTDDGPTLSHSDLMRLLSDMQLQAQPTGNLVDLKPQKLNVRQALFNMVDQGSTPAALGRVDDDVINLVSMLFEFILDDHHLPTPMKALLGRLQIPMLKVAVLDKSFFSRGGHPARRLLNELATAAMGWNASGDMEKDPLYKKISGTVEAVLKDFDDDVSLFEGWLEEFTTFIGTERRRAELIEQRTRDAEEGLGKSQRARAVVGYTLNEKAVGKRLPRVAVEILRDCWSSYMFLIHVREGVDTPAWDQAVQTAEDLIWSVQIEPGGAERGQLLKMIPSLLQRLRKGFTQVAYSKSKMRSQLKELEVFHLRCLRSSAASQPAATDLSASPDGEGITPPGEIGNQVVDSPVIVEHAVDSEPQQDTHVADDEHANIAKSMSTGTWVEIKEEDDKCIRAKLAAIIRATGKYIFVNRVGMKIAEKTLPGIVSDLRSGSMHILDNALLFDRALENVIGHLREMKN